MDITQLLEKLLSQNQFASGGLLLMALGAVGGWLYKLVPILYNFLKRKFIVTVDIQSNNDVFRWFAIWLAHHSYSKKSRLLTVNTDGGFGESMAGNPDNFKDEKPNLYFSPAPGNHLIWYQGRPVWIRRDREKKMGNDGNGRLSIYEQFEIVMLGRDRELAKSLLREVRDFIHNLEKDDTSVYSATKYGEWRRIKKQKPRALESVILKNDLQYEIYETLREFYSNPEWYTKRGIPYRKGYLLHGPPGTGKTSLVKAMAGAMDMNIYIININNGISNDNFTHAMTEVPRRSIILIEDVDAAFTQREKTDEDQNVTFKTLLNTIDGVISPEGTILFMTTNHIDKLDPALIRKGRVDRKIYVGPADTRQMQRLFEHFYPQSNGEAKAFADALPENKFTPADIQGHFLNYKSDPERALQNLNELWHT